MRHSRAELGSLRDLFAPVPDARREQGRKHRLETVLSLCALAKLAGLSGPVATARYAAGLDQEELRALGAWRDPDAARWTAPSAATFCRVLADPDALAGVLRDWAVPRLAESAEWPALTADGKRIRVANRQAHGSDHFDTVTLATHDGRPVASRCCRDEVGELAALRALLEDVDIQGRVLTLDALHTTRDTPRAIVEAHGAYYELSVKGNCPDSFA